MRTTISWSRLGCGTQRSQMREFAYLQDLGSGLCLCWLCILRQVTIVSKLQFSHLGILIDSILLVTGLNEIIQGSAWSLAQSKEELEFWRCFLFIVVSL